MPLGVACVAPEELDLRSCRSIIHAMKLACAIAILMACSLAYGKKPEPRTAPVVSDARKPIASPDAAANTTPPDAAAPKVVAADDNPRTSELCGEVLLKIVACHRDKQFLSALDKGVDAKRKVANKKHLAQIMKWRYSDCGALPTAIEDSGFLDNWSTVSGTPGILYSCGKLGTAVRSAGGLFGGDVAN
jgi:hypothetical protein